MKIFFCSLLLFFSLAACVRQTSVDLAPGESLIYRPALDPIGSVTSWGNSSPTDSPSSYHRLYLIWETQHHSLERSLSHNSLHTLEAHRKTVHALRLMASHWGGTIQDRLLSYGNLYQSLLRESRSGISPRILQHKYQSLEQKIQQFSPEEFAHYQARTKSP